jgi:Ni/Co efflux regulator RcnB
MKNLLISIFAFSLATAAPTVLLAQDEHHDSAPHGAMSGPPADHGTPSGGTDRMDQAYRADEQSHDADGDAPHGPPSHRPPVVDHTTVNMWMSRRFAKTSTRRTTFTTATTMGRRIFLSSLEHGDRLPREYWAQNYWLNNYLNFGLIAPPDGYVWVRYGPDAVLIDERHG